MLVAVIVNDLLASCECIVWVTALLTRLKFVVNRVTGCILIVSTCTEKYNIKTDVECGSKFRAFMSNFIKEFLWKSILEGISLKRFFLQISLQGRCKFSAYNYFSGFKLWLAGANWFSPNVFGLKRFDILTQILVTTVFMVVTSCPVGIRLHGVTHLETLIIAVVLL